MGDNYLYQTCPECKGDGVITRQNFEGANPVEVNESCPNCDENGLVLWGVLRDELIGEE